MIIWCILFTAGMTKASAFQNDFPVLDGYCQYSSQEKLFSNYINCGENKSSVKKQEKTLKNRMSDYLQENPDESDLESLIESTQSRLKKQSKAVYKFKYEYKLHILQNYYIAKFGTPSWNDTSDEYENEEIYYGCAREWQIADYSYNYTRYKPCCEWLSRFNRKSIQNNDYPEIGAGYLCFDEGQGLPICMYEGTSQEGRYYRGWLNFLRFDNCAFASKDLKIFNAKLTTPPHTTPNEKAEILREEKHDFFYPNPTDIKIFKDGQQLYNIDIHSEIESERHDENQTTLYIKKLFFYPQQAGNYIIRGRLDTQNRYQEFNENNNTFELEVTVESNEPQYQDLEIISAKIISEDISLHDTVTIQRKEKHSFDYNQPTTIEITHDGNTTNHTQNTIITNSRTDTDGNRRYTKRLSFTPTSAGNYNIKGFLDKTNAIPETLENNNTFSLSFEIDCLPDPDPQNEHDIRLYNTQLLSSNTLISYEPIEIERSEKSNFLANRESEVTIYKGNTPIQSPQIHIEEIDNWHTNGNYYYTKKLSFTPQSNWTYKILIQADPNNYEQEINENNNSSSTTVQVQSDLPNTWGPFMVAFRPGHTNKYKAHFWDRINDPQNTQWGLESHIPNNRWYRPLAYCQMRYPTKNMRSVKQVYPPAFYGRKDLANNSYSSPAGASRVLTYICQQ